MRIYERNDSPCWYVEFTPTDGVAQTTVDRSRPRSSVSTAR